MMRMVLEIAMVLAVVLGLAVVMKSSVQENNSDKNLPDKEIGGDDNNDST